MNPKEILVINSYSWYNKGDAGIAIATLTGLKKLWPNAKITLTSYTPFEDEPHYSNLNTQVTQPFFIDDHPSITNKFVKRLAMFKDLIKFGFYLGFYRASFKASTLLSPKFNYLISKYEQADLVVSLGGGFLNDNFGEAFLIHLFQIFVSVNLGKPTVISAQSIGPFKHKFNHVIIRAILNKVRLITVREVFSKIFLSQIKVNSNVYLTTDIAFSLTAPEIVDQRLILEGSKPFVGITVRKWVYPKSENPAKEYENYINTFSRYIDYLIEERNATVFLLPQVIGPGQDDDRLTANKLLLKIKHKEKAVNLTQDYSPFEIMQLLKQMEFFVGTRMHSNIYSMLVGTPVLAISYEYKTTGIMQELGLTTQVIPIEELRFETLVSKTDEMLLNLSSNRSELKEKIRLIREKANINISLLKYI